MSHTSDTMCYTTEVFVVHGNKVLLKRHRKYGSIWLSVGGHIEDGEDPTETAIREVKEEVGLDIVLDEGSQRFKTTGQEYRDIIPPVAIGRHSVSDGPEHVILIYFARAESDKVVPEVADDEWRWVGKGELAAMDLLPNVRAYAIAALDALGAK